MMGGVAHQKPSDASPSHLVIGTNDSSIVSKRSAERNGYFTHPQFLKYFVHKPQRRAALINIGYTIRTLLVDLIIRRFLETHAAQPLPPDSQEWHPEIFIVNLGCGYDPGFFKHATHSHSEFNLSHQRIRYLDVDYPDLISKKHQWIARSEELNLILPAFSETKLGDWVQLPNGRASYALLGFDLCDADGFVKRLTELLKGRTHIPILFVSEVSTVYMPAEKSDQLLQRISTSFPNSVWSCLEQVLPPTPSAFSTTMLAHFHKLRTPIRGTLGYPTMAKQVDRFQSLWKNVEMSTMQDLWNAFDHYPAMKEEKKRILHVEPFDEWEELDLFLSHYIVGIAYSQPEAMKAQKPRSISFGLPPLHIRSDEVARKLAQVPPEPNLSWSYLSLDSPIQRRGHTSTVLPNGQQLVFGGFGLQHSIHPTDPKVKYAGAHNKLSHPILLDLSPTCSFQTTVLPIDSTTPPARLFHTATLIHKDDKTAWVFLFGGRSSPQVLLDDAYLFDCKTSAWKSVHRSEEELLWPPPRFRHVALKIQIRDSFYIFIHGGIGLEGVILKDSWLFDPNTTRWIPLDALDEIIGPRHSHQIIYDSEDSQLYVFGGIETICDEPGIDRIAKNIHFLLEFGPDLSLKVGSCDLHKLVLNFQTDDPMLLNRYSHRITVWDEENKQLVISGGMSKNGLIVNEKQIVLLDLKRKTFHVFDLSDRNPRTLIAHTTSIVHFTNESNGQSHHVKAVLVLGGGATCFSFGSCFDTSADIITEFNLKLLDFSSKDLIETKKKYHQVGTLSSSSEDTWNQVKSVKQIEKVTAEIWRKVLVESIPIKFNFQDEIGDCLKLWEADYLKSKSGERKCSIHQSNSDQLNWHEKNFQYSTISFKELIDRTLLKEKKRQDIDNTNTEKFQTVYLRSLSKNPKQASNFFKDFPEISDDFKIPRVVDEYIKENDYLFSSVLRVSGSDMGLWAHYDTYDNILVQIKGKKLVRLWHPREMMNLYIDGSSSHIPDFNCPDLDSFPLYRKAHPIMCTLEPGDTVFIPANWIHSIQTIEPSISINIFFKTERLQSFYDSRVLDVWGNVDLSPYRLLHQKIFNEVINNNNNDDNGDIERKKKGHQVKSLDPLDWKTCSKFNQLPLAQRQFYLKKLASDLIRFADQLTE